MRRQLQFLQPIAYTTDGIIMKNTRIGTWDTPSKYMILITYTGRLEDLSIEHCQQIDDYLAGETQDNIFI
jgi:hypothetical protein